MAAPVQEIISPQYAPASAAALYISGSGITTRIDKLTVVNGDSVARTVTIWRVPSGGAADNSSLSTPTLTILAGKTFNSPNEYGHYLNPGDAIWVQASAGSAISVSAAGTLVTG